MYCKTCGSKIILGNTIFCFNCGSIIGYGYSYCIHCGTQIKNKDTHTCEFCKSNINNRSILDKIFESTNN